MAKLTTLQLENAILRNCGESEVENLNNLTGIQSVIWDKLTEALLDICTEQNTQYKFLEADGAIPMVTNSYRYLISELTSGADMQKEDRESFLAADFAKIIKYRTPQEFFNDYPGGINGVRFGCPTEYTRYGGYIVFNNTQTAAENGKNVTFRYWKLPTLPATGSPSVTLDIPEPFDRTVLVPLATMKTLAYLGNDEAIVHKLQVFGDGRDVEGSLAKLKQIYLSPEIKPRVTYIF
jgi:hypothetical protein